MLAYLNLNLACFSSPRILRFTLIHKPPYDLQGVHANNALKDNRWVSIRDELLTFSDEIRRPSILNVTPLFKYRRRFPALDKLYYKYI